MATFWPPCVIYYSYMSQCQIAASQEQPNRTTLSAFIFLLLPSVCLFFSHSLSSSIKAALEVRCFYSTHLQHSYHSSSEGEYWQNYSHWQVSGTADHPKCRVNLYSVQNKTGCARETQAIRELPLQMAHDKKTLMYIIQTMARRYQHLYKETVLRTRVAKETFCQGETPGPC